MADLSAPHAWKNPGSLINNDLVQFAQAMTDRPQHRPTIEPVPVAERLPGPEDCDAEGRCWWFNPGVKASSNPHIALSSWRLTHMLASKPMGTHWRPYNALPLPQQPS
jgi:hypothetical protein